MFIPIVDPFLVAILQQFGLLIASGAIEVRDIMKAAYESADAWDILKHRWGHVGGQVCPAEVS